MKGDVKEGIAREHFKAAERDGRFGVVMVGIAQERTSAWRGWREGGSDGHPHFEYRRQSIFPNNCYWYIRVPDWGPAFLKTTACAPYSAWLYLNGNQRAKRQAIQRDIPFTPLDNGFAACEDPVALADICASLQAADVQAFFDHWQAALPSPLTAEDRARGYHHELAFRQAEISDTRMFDRPAAGRAWFERTIPDQLTLGRPDRVAIVFGRRVSCQTPGRFQPKISNKGGGAGDPGALSRLEGQAVLPRGSRAQNRDDRQRHPRLRRRPSPHPGQLGRVGGDRPPSQPALPGPSAPGVPMRARRHDASARGAAIHRRWPTRPRPALRRAAHDGTARLPVLLSARIRGSDEPQSARADRRADPRLQRAPDDRRRLRANGSSSASPAPSDTSSPARDADWPSFSPRPTRGSSTHP